VERGTKMAYCSASDVFAYSQNLTHGEPSFDDESRPTLSQVSMFLSSGCAAIHTALSGAGWSVPATSGTELYDKLKDLNALFGAGRSELSRVNTTVTSGERTRAQLFLDMFNSELNTLVSTDLTEIGGALSTTDGEIFVGGISQDNKDSYYNDTDRVQARFRKNQFKFSDTIYPK